MKNHRLKVMAASAVLSTSTLLGAATVHATEVQDVLRAGAQKVEEAQQAQQRVDRVADQTNTLLGEFKNVNRQIEGLRVYNAQLERQVENQQQSMDELRESIDGATTMEQQLTPLTLRMIEGLEAFIRLDMPFYTEERQARLEQLRGNQERADLSSAEKFRQVLEAYQIEHEYGQTIDAYTGMVPVDGEEREVNIIRVGRIALLYQTKDQAMTGAWDKDAGEWVEVSAGQYRSAVAQVIRIANRQASIDIMRLPIPAPEAAQ